MDLAIAAQYYGLAPCVVSGCELFPQSGGDFNIGPGLVWIEGGIHRYDGQAALTLPLEMYLGAEVLSDPRPYQTGGSDFCMGERKVLTRAVSNDITAVLVTADGIIDFNKAREKTFRSMAEMLPVADFAAEWDGTGKGKYGTKAYGWAKCNGQNGTPNMEGNFPVGQGGNGVYAATRATGGAATVSLTAAQNGPHTHVMDQAGAHTHGYVDHYAGEEATVDAGNNTRRTRDQFNNSTTASAGSHTHTIQDSGAGQGHENRPPFVVLGFKMWIGF